MRSRVHTVFEVVRSCRARACRARIGRRVCASSSTKPTTTESPNVRRSELERERDAGVGGADDQRAQTGALAVTLALEREQARLEPDAAAAEQDQQRGHRRRGEDRQRHVLEVGVPREHERRREDAGGRGRDDAHRFFDRRVAPDGSVEAHHLVDEQLGDDRDQQVRDEAAHAERRVAAEAERGTRGARPRRSRRSRGPRRLVVPRPWATPYTERASRCGSEVAFGPSLSGAAENRPTPVPPRPPLSQASSQIRPACHTQILPRSAPSVNRENARSARTLPVSLCVECDMLAPNRPEVTTGPSRIRPN